MLIGVAASALGHGLIVAALLTARAAKIEHRAEPVTVSLVRPLELAPKAPTPTPSPKPAAAARAEHKPKPKPPPEVETLPTVATATQMAAAEVGEGELSGAATAGAGGGGGSCDMVRRLQDALRKDSRIQAALADAYRGRALRVWNGGWVLHPGQEGNGLAVVREAIMWEVGFSPAACKQERVHGLVLISLGERSGAARVVLGTGDWRWSDLLFSH